MDEKHHNSSVESHDKCKKHRLPSSSSFQADGSLKTSNSSSSGLSSCSRSRSSDSDCRKLRTRCEEKKLEVIPPSKSSLQKSCRLTYVLLGGHIYKVRQDGFRVNRQNCEARDKVDETAYLQPFPFISIIGFPKKFKLVCNINVVHEGAAIWLFYSFTKMTSSAVLSLFLSTDNTGKKHSRSDSGKTRYFTTYPQVASFLLMEYAISKVIAETQSDITRSTHPSNMKPF